MRDRGEVCNGLHDCQQTGRFGGFSFDTRLGLSRQKE